MTTQKIKDICNLIRYTILTQTTAAGSGHPTSSLSAVELMAELWFGGTLRMDLDDPKALTNDRVIFSKGHSAPLLYSLYHAAGYLSYDELLTLRKFDSVLEGHPTPRFEPVEVATGSLGQGLSAGMGMALGFKKRFTDANKRIPHVFVLMGDSEIAEGQIWEAAQLAAHYKLDNLVGIVDVNRLGQRGETMEGWNVKSIGAKFTSFGWKTIVLEDGHDLESIRSAFDMVNRNTEGVPVMIVARTIKGAGIPLLENRDGWHGKAVPADKLEEALSGLGKVDTSRTYPVVKPNISYTYPPHEPEEVEFAFETGQTIATREAYGVAIDALARHDGNVLVIDAETSNSTFAETVRKSRPEQFIEMFIAEQNMVTAGLGLSKVGYDVYASTFAAFFARAFDQIRMAQYADGALNLVGSHAGVSIGQDGSSQMGLEDIAIMRSIRDSVVLYPSDAVSTVKMVIEMHNHPSMNYLRLTREKTPVLYNMDEEFPIGGSKLVRHSSSDAAVVIAAGITLHQALAAHNTLQSEGITIAVLDAYSVKPLDEATIRALAEKTGHVVIVEDHYPYGGLGEAVIAALKGMAIRIDHLAVKKTPRSGSPAELLAYEEIDAAAIVKTVRTAQR
ncbi:MAG: transketolase [Patescibacteria group bacterium]|nr:transketolase [Patescibacteria group bacterium]